MVNNLPFLSVSLPLFLIDSTKVRQVAPDAKDIKLSLLNSFSPPFEALKRVFKKNRGWFSHVKYLGHVCWFSLLKILKYKKVIFYKKNFVKRFLVHFFFGHPAAPGLEMQVEARLFRITEGLTFVPVVS